MTRHRPLALALVIGALVLAGCDSEPEKAAPAASPSTAAPAWSLTYDAGRTLRLATRASEVVLGRESATFLFTDRPTGPTDRIAAVDLTTGQRTPLARTGFPGGSIVALARAGSDLVYVDESARGNRDPGAARWRVVVLGTGQVLASSGEQRVTQSPDLITIDGSAVWTVDDAAYGWKPGGQVERREVLPGDELECTPPASAPELVGACERSPRWIAWVERGPGAVEGDFTEPAHLFFASAAAGSALPLGEVSGDAHLALLGNFLLLEGENGGVRAISLEQPTASVVVVPEGSSTTVSPGRGTGVAILIQEDAVTRLRVLSAGQLRVTSS